MPRVAPPKVEKGAKKEMAKEPRSTEKGALDQPKDNGKEERTTKEEKEEERTPRVETDK